MSNFSLKDKKAKMMRIMYYYEVRRDSLVQPRLQRKASVIDSFRAKAVNIAGGFLKEMRSCSCWMGPLAHDPNVDKGDDIRPSGDSLLRDVQQLLQKKKGDLYSLAGERRGRSLYEDHVQQWDYVLIYAQADRQKGQEVRGALERTQADVAVAGPWSIGLGDSLLSTWERLLNSGTVVVVLVSKELYRERMLNLCFPEVLSDERGIRVVPMFLEDLDETEITSELRPIKWRQGIVLYRRGVEAAVRELVRHTSTYLRYLRELEKIDDLLQDLPQYLGTSIEPVEAPK